MRLEGTMLKVGSTYYDNALIIMAEPRVLKDRVQAALTAGQESGY